MREWDCGRPGWGEASTMVLALAELETSLLRFNLERRLRGGDADEVESKLNLADDEVANELIVNQNASDGKEKNN